MFELTIERLAYGGDAIGHLEDGRVAFISGGCPGDRVAAEVVEEKDRFVRVRIAEVLEASADRVTAPCPYFGACGGCTWQHVAYAAQLEAKRQSVVDALLRIGGFPDSERLVNASVPSPAEYGYRNKIELVANPASTRPRLGFHRAGSEEVVEIDECLLLPKRARKAPKALGGALRYLAGETDLGLSRVGIRCAAHTKDLEVALWTVPGPFQRGAAAKMLSQALPLSSLVRVLSRGPLKRRAIAGVEVLSGKGFWRERLAGIPYSISAPSFFQVNSTVAEELVKVVLGILEPDGSDRVLDLYAGAGTFTLPLAQVGGEVVAVESAGSSIRDLRRNLEQNGLWAEVIGGDAAREIASLGHFDIVVVDPPRSGLAPEVVSALGGCKPRALAYVSCDPATLARDARALAEAGLELASATPIDLFPQTYHVETVAHFIPSA
ncbi:MAG: 23S rRNA (uracil(1939)-C(5))-methyltransferase RlmD [Actinobacteria bacterium HGW-Actinobacteria-7]|nr:MAG: 23S rRNA (uracil(1939)-C(5))-methyltransferase RlmD [Actinobacteria bacterium HGW-Actinobacteria-7]